MGFTAFFGGIFDVIQGILDLFYYFNDLLSRTKFDIYEEIQPTDGKV